MKKDKQAKKWLWGTLLVGAAAVILLIWAGNAVLYPTYMHWRGRPTAADKAELYAFAEKLGYEPENEIAYFRQCNGWGSAKSCHLNLYFLETSRLDDAFFESSSTVRLLSRQTYRPLDVEEMLSFYNSRGKNMTLHDLSSGREISQENLASLRVRHEGIRLLDINSGREKNIGNVFWSELDPLVYVDGQITNHNALIIHSTYRCPDRWLGICE